MSRISFSTLTAKVGEKYSNYDIILEDADPKSGSPEVVLGLRPLLRVPKADRLTLSGLQAKQRAAEAAAEVAQTARAEAVKAAVDKGETPPEEELADSAEGSLEYLRNYIRLVANDRDLAELFVERVGDDLAFLAFVVGEHAKETEAGEASPSES